MNLLRRRQKNMRQNGNLNVNNYFHKICEAGAVDGVGMEREPFLSYE